MSQNPPEDPGGLDSEPREGPRFCRSTARSATT